MGDSLYVSLFEAAQGATEARLNQMAATATMGEAQTQVLNTVTNSWTTTRSGSAFTVHASEYKSWMNTSQVKKAVESEINAYYARNSFHVSQGGGWKSWASGFASMPSADRAKIATFIEAAREDGRIHVQHQSTSSQYLYDCAVTSITTSCAKSLLGHFLKEGMGSHIPQALLTNTAPSRVTLAQLAEHAASTAKNATASNTALADQAKEAQYLLQEAQRSYTAAQANANAGVQAVQNQSSQDSYMAQQDAQLAAAINAALQAGAGMTISV